MKARHLVALLLILFGAGSLPAMAQDNSQPDGNSQANASSQSSGSSQAKGIKKSDEKFLKEAIEDNYAEIQMGKLAQEKAQSPEVKSYGETLANDHEKANNDAIKLADSLGIQPPTGPDKHHQKKYEKLQKKSGADFDKAFVKDEVKDHKKAISKFEKHSKGNDQLAEYAKQTLPVLQKHKQMAQSLKQSSSAASSGSSQGNS